MVGNICQSELTLTLLVDRISAIVEPFHEALSWLDTELVAVHGAHPYLAANYVFGVWPALLQSWTPEPNHSSGPKDSAVSPLRRPRL